jgi:hypothetical protein
VAGVLVDSVSVGAVTSYEFEDVTANHTISATFAPNPDHTITASAGAGGTISPSGAVSVADGSDQTFTITADPGYHVVDVRVDGVSVGAVTSYAFTNVTANHTISATFAPSGGCVSGFPDVPGTHPYCEAIADLANRGIIDGYTNGYFGPNDPVRRQQFAKMVTGAGGYPVSEADVCHFTDVETSDATTLYPDNFIAVCAAKGITVGKTATTFDPYSYITRYQVISMVVRAADDLDPGLLATPPSGYGTWRADPTHGANAARAEYGGLLAGLDLTTLNPYGNMPRGEVAQVLHNLIQLLLTATGGS